MNRVSRARLPDFCFFIVCVFRFIYDFITLASNAMLCLKWLRYNRKANKHSEYHSLFLEFLFLAVDFLFRVDHWKIEFLVVVPVQIFGQTDRKKLLVQKMIFHFFFCFLCLHKVAEEVKSLKSCSRACVLNACLDFDKVVPLK